jgi:cytoskeletal protein CcmA (bactofilin family)
LTNRQLQNRPDTLIGAGVRVSGNITFSGVLRIHGDVHGDVLCDADDIGTAVVGHSGKVIL